MITHLESDILECEVKWALGSRTRNKASAGDGTPAELFHILKDDAFFRFRKLKLRTFRDTKGTFHAKMGSIKDRNGMDLTKAKEEVARIHRSTKNIFMTQIITMV